MTSLLWIGLALLVVLGWLRIRARLGKGRWEAEPPSLDEEDLRRIEREGRLETGEEPDEPLDLDEVEREERRFWEQHWDRPEEW